MVFKGKLLKGYRIYGSNDKITMIDLPNVEERKVGKWKAIDDTHSQCMECGAIFCISSSDEWEVSYCPNCSSRYER